MTWEEALGAKDKGFYEGACCDLPEVLVEIMGPSLHKEATIYFIIICFFCIGHLLGYLSLGSAYLGRY